MKLKNVNKLLILLPIITMLFVPLKTAYMSGPFDELQGLFAEQRTADIVTDPYGDYGDALGLVTNIILGVSSTIAIITLIIGFVQLTTSRGDPKSTQVAFNTIKWSILAGVLVISSFTIKVIILNLIGGADADITTELPDF